MSYLIPSIIIWLCLVGISYCIYRILQESSLNRIQNYELSKFKLPSFIIRYIRIDSTFTKKEKILIVEALQEWEYKTSGMVAFNVVNLEANDIHIDGNLPQEVEEHQPYEVMTFIKAFTYSKIIKKVEEEHGRNIYGYAHWSDFMYIAMVADRIPNDQTFKTVAMHEVGHLLGMGHLKCKNSLMYKHTNKNIYTLTKKDLSHFLECYKYEISNRPKDILLQLQQQEQAKNTC